MGLIADMCLASAMGKAMNSINSTNWSSSDHKCSSEDGEVCEDRGTQKNTMGELGAREDVTGKA